MPQNGDRQVRVQDDLRRRGPDLDPADEGRFGGSDDPQVRHLDVGPERIGDQVDVMPEFGQRLDSVIFTEGGAAGFEERLRGEHQDPERATRGAAGGNGDGDLRLG
jgi:hypothetical protein